MTSHSHLKKHSKSPKMSKKSKSPKMSKKSKSPTMSKKSKSPDMTKKSKSPKMTKKSKSPKMTKKSKSPNMTKKSKSPKMTKKSKSSGVIKHNGEKVKFYDLLAKKPFVTSNYKMVTKIVNGKNGKRKVTYYVTENPTRRKDGSTFENWKILSNVKA